MTRKKIGKRTYHLLNILYSKESAKTEKARAKKYYRSVRLETIIAGQVYHLWVWGKRR